MKRVSRLVRPDGRPSDRSQARHVLAHAAESLAREPNLRTATAQMYRPIDTETPIIGTANHCDAYTNSGMDHTSIVDRTDHLEPIDSTCSASSPHAAAYARAASASVPLQCAGTPRTIRFQSLMDAS